MAQVTGLGGPFLKAKDPKALAAWYEQHLGIGFGGGTYAVLPLTGSGFNILSFFKEDNKYFEPSEKSTMLNLRVDDLDAMLAKLKEAGITMLGDPMDEEYGKFGWILDPEGNKIELWQPPA